MTLSKRWSGEKGLALQTEFVDEQFVGAAWSRFRR
jgi:hypothetical protein